LQEENEMSAKKRTKKARAAAKPARKSARMVTTDRLQEAWKTAGGALHTAQTEAERQLAKALKKNRFHAREVRDGVDAFRKRFERERRRLAREFDRQVESIGDRVQQERQNLVDAIDEGVRNGLAALNIPSRKEVAELTRKVERLSHRIDSLRR
jgi:poly(hydroxyalkanoate) granule-associated protein